MAGSSIIGALRVVLGLDSASMETGVKQASKSLLSFEKSAKSLQGGMSGLQKVMAAVAVGAFGKFIKSGIEAGDQIAKTSKRLGISTDAYQELSYAAGLAAVSQEDFDKALEQFNKRMGDFSGNVTEAQKALGQMGISIDQIKGKPLEQQIRAIADGFQRMGVTQESARISTDLFSKGGQRLLNVLIEGSAGLNHYAEEARKLGFVVGGDVLKASEEASDEFDRIGKALKVAGIQIAAGFLPALQSIRDTVTSQAFQDGVRSLASGFAGMVKWVAENHQAVAALAAAWLGLKAGMTVGSLLGPVGTLIGGLTGALLGGAAAAKYFEPKLQALNKQYAEQAAEIKRVEEAGEGANRSQESWLGSTGEFSGNVLPALRAELVETRKKINDIEVAMEEANNEMSRPPPPTGGGGGFDASISKIIDDLKLKTAEARGEFNRLPEGFAELAKGKVPLEALRLGVAGLTEEWTGVAEAVARYNVAKATEDVKPQFQKDQEELDRLKLSFELVGGDAEVFRKKMLMVKASIATAWGEMADAIVSPMASAFKDLAGMNKKYAGAAKAFAIAEALVQTYLGATKAFTAAATFGLPFAIAAAAAATAAGLANVAKISATEFAHGGSFRVGGSGGMDSQMIQFMATPGEMVDVRTPGTTGSSSGGTTVNLTIQGDRVTRNQMREMFDTINAGIRDGYRIKFAT